jgi:hypothetical protein
MKKTLVIILFLLAGCLCRAQLTLQPLLPQEGLFQKSQLWNILAVNNTSGVLECYVVLTLSDRESGTEVMSATTASFSLGKEAKQLNNALLTPVQYSYFSFTGDKTNDFLTVGSYTACYKLMGGKQSLELAEACVPFDVEPLSPPALTYPADSSSLQVQPSQFTWQPPAPLTMFQQLHYEVVIAEILPGQRPEEAIELNAPFYTDLNVPGSVMGYAGAYPSFEKGKWYAWQVVAKDGENYAAKTEVWDFIMDTKNPVIKPDAVPYVKLKRGYEAGFTITKGVLKFEYNNEINDKKISYSIIEFQSSNNSVIKKGRLPITPGQNFIELPLGKPIKKSKNYMFELINSRGEKWNIKFLMSK